MITYDEVVPTLIRAVQQRPDSAVIKRACLIRDLVGRVRLAVEVVDGQAFDEAGLEQELTRTLQPYFAAPVLLSAGSSESARLARNLFQQSSEWPESWPSEVKDSLTGAAYQVDTAKWRCLQRVLSKESWLSTQAAGSPWPLHAGIPAIVAFFSFKGGVGRTSLLATTAWMLAKAGKKVVVIDLDIEAPGLAGIFGLAPSRGVVDFLLDCIAADGNYQGSIESLLQPAASFPVELRQHVQVLGAGELNKTFLEKLARIDYTVSGSDAAGESPASEALRTLLKKIRNEQKPDFILIDSRAGVHDLGGLSLHALSHVDVLVARNSSQSLSGLTLTLQTVAARRKPEDRRPLIVQSFAPHTEDSRYASETAPFREKVYDLFCKYMWSADEDPAQLDDDTSAHFPSVVSYTTERSFLNEFNEGAAASWVASDTQSFFERLLELSSPEEDVEVGP